MSPWATYGSNATQLIEVWNGTTWSVQSGAAVGTMGTLSAVSCAAAGACMAVGSVPSSNGDLVGFSELWSGSSWTAETVPDPRPGTTVDALTSVSCAAGGACSALGTYSGNGDQDDQTLTAEWDGSSWSVQGGPGGGTKYPELGSVSCAAVNDCEAVGAGAEGFNGAAWSAQHLPGAGLSGVSCLSTSACVGVGDSTVDAYNGTAWTRSTEWDAERRIGSAADGGLVLVERCLRGRRLLHHGRRDRGAAGRSATTARPGRRSRRRPWRRRTRRAASPPCRAPVAVRARRSAATPVGCS